MFSVFSVVFSAVVEDAAVTQAGRLMICNQLLVIIIAFVV